MIICFKRITKELPTLCVGEFKSKIVGIPSQVKPIHSKVDQTQNLRFQDYPLRSISNYDGAIYLLGPQYI